MQRAQRQAQLAFSGLAFGFGGLRRLVLGTAQGRLDRLPVRVQSKLLDVAINQLIKHPDRYAVKTHTDVAEARLYIAVEAAHLRGEF